MITNKEIEGLFDSVVTAFPISGFSGIEGKHMYLMAQSAYALGVTHAANACAPTEPQDMAGNASAQARQCREAVLALLKDEAKA